MFPLFNGFLDNHSDKFCVYANILKLLSLKVYCDIFSTISLCALKLLQLWRKPMYEREWVSVLVPAATLSQIFLKIWLIHWLKLWVVNQVETIVTFQQTFSNSQNDLRKQKWSNPESAHFTKSPKNSRYYLRLTEILLSGSVSMLPCPYKDDTYWQVFPMFLHQKLWCKLVLYFTTRWHKKSLSFVNMK